MSPNFEMLDLRAFALVAERLSFHAAARELVMSQPALSRRVQKLEASVGATLFDRTTRTVRLTPAGAEMLPVVRRLLDELDGSMLGAMLAGERRAGRITVASIPSMAVRFFPALLEEFAAYNRNLRVRLLDLSSTECIDAVRSGATELAIALQPLDLEGLRFDRLIDDPYGFVCRPEDPLAKAKQIGWAAIGDRPLVIGHRASGNRTLLEAAVSAKGLRPNWFYEVARLSSALALVKAGLGASILPALACDSGCGRDEVVWRPIEGLEVVRTIGIVRRAGSELTPAASRLSSLLSEQVAAYEAAVSD